MRYDVLGGSDVATIVLFWPAHLPEDLEARLARDRDGFLAEEAAAGRLLRFPCTADGSYKVAVFVDEPLPEDLAEHEVDPVDLGVLDVPDGPGYFGGVEGLALDPDALSKTRRSAVGDVHLPAGRYRARLSEFDPGELHEQEWVEGRLDPEGRAAESRQDTWYGVGAILLLVGVGMLAFGGSRPWATACIALAVVGFVGGRLTARGPGWENLQATRKAYEERFASYFLVLEREDV